MKVLASVVSAAIIVALAGCNQLGAGGGNASGNSASNGSAGNASGDKDPAGNSAAPAADASGGKDPASATPASSGAVNLDRTYVMGRWTDDGNCGNAIEFTQDGRFITASGGGGLWNLDGDRLTMTGRATATIRIVPVDQNTMTVVNTDGSLGRSTRC
jgi:hypothetical protein